MNIFIAYFAFGLMTWRFPLWFPGAIGSWKNMLRTNRKLETPFSKEELAIWIACLWLLLVLMSSFGNLCERAGAYLSARASKRAAKRLLAPIRERHLRARNRKEKK